MLDGSIIFGMCPIYDNRDNQIKNHYMLRYESVITECSFNYFTTYIENKLLNFLKVLHVHIKGSIYRMRGRFEAYDPRANQLVMDKLLVKI